MPHAGLHLAISEKKERYCGGDKVCLFFPFIVCKSAWRLGNSFLINWHISLNSVCDKFVGLETHFLSLLLQRTSVGELVLWRRRSELIHYVCYHILKAGSIHLSGKVLVKSLFWNQSLYRCMWLFVGLDHILDIDIHIVDWYLRVIQMNSMLGGASWSQLALCDSAPCGSAQLPWGMLLKDFALSPSNEDMKTKSHSKRDACCLSWIASHFGHHNPAYSHNFHSLACSRLSSKNFEWKSNSCVWLELRMLSTQRRQNHCCWKNAHVCTWDLDRTLEPGDQEKVCQTHTRHVKLWDDQEEDKEFSSVRRTDTSHWRCHQYHTHILVPTADGVHDLWCLVPCWDILSSSCLDLKSFSIL